MLVLLDFSSAFDTIDHPILAHGLNTDFGFTDTVLQRFSSSPTDYTQYILSNHCSVFAPVYSGVHQGSVLGHILSSMYDRHLSTIIDSYSIMHHSFAGDLRLQMSALIDKISEPLHSMQTCICDIKAWTSANILKLNDYKTDPILATSQKSKHLHNLLIDHLVFSKFLSKKMKNLGFTLGKGWPNVAHAPYVGHDDLIGMIRIGALHRCEKNKPCNIQYCLSFSYFVHILHRECYLAHIYLPSVENMLN